jgi:hypothetical protein
MVYGLNYPLDESKVLEIELDIHAKGLLYMWYAMHKTNFKKALLMESRISLLLSNSIEHIYQSNSWCASSMDPTRAV